MAQDIVVPSLGESVTEATIAKWFKKPGDAVKADEPLVELETDKVTVEVPAPASGVLQEQSVKEGDTVEVGAKLGSIEVGGKAAASATPTPAKTSAPVTGGKAPKSEEQVNPAVKAESVNKESPAMPDLHQVEPKKGGEPAPMKSGPAASKLLAENPHIKAENIQGSAKDGRVTKGDVLSAIENGDGMGTAPAAGPREERIKMSKLRQTIAKRLKDSQNTAAILTTFNEIDMTNVMALRNQYKDDFEKTHGVRLGFMGFFIKAAVAALKQIPSVNAEMDGDAVIYKNYYDIGVAVGGAAGLVVPVIRDCDKKSIAQIEADIASAAQKAKDGTLTMADMTGGTFTVSNGGVYGSLMSTPIINPPQSGILGMHKTEERPVVVNGAIVIRPMMYVALSYDHRIIDGRESVTFLVAVKKAVEDPRRLLLGI